MNNRILENPYLFAPAKVNLNLYVKGRNKNGYHNISSLVGFTEIYDVITMQLSKSTTLELSGSEGSLIQHEKNTNIILKTINFLQQEAKIPLQVDIKLEKNIPVAAGLGGGSADAAAVIKGACKILGNKELFNINDELLAGKLGSDVPVCFYGKGAWIEGYGNKLVPANEWPESWLVIANPRVPVSTRDIFSKNKNFTPEPPQKYIHLTSFQEFSDYLRGQKNDLTPAAIAVCPVIKNVISAIKNLPNCSLARMSGSGPSCFGLFETQKDATNALDILQSMQPNWWVKSTKLNFYAH